MKEIGGYIEFEHYHGFMLHDGAIALNCGRNCLAYLFKSRGIKKLKVPYYICDSVLNVCSREGVEKVYYHTGIDFKPIDLTLDDNEWLYLVNLYGQLTNEEIKEYIVRYHRVIVDQANGYFEQPISGVDTLYTCRKWFGVADGAFLYTDKVLDDEFPRAESYDRMRFLMGRFERTASEFYGEYNNNNKFFTDEPIKQMSNLTLNLLHSINYAEIQERRMENFSYCHKRLKGINQLKLRTASFMYPLMVENGAVIRKALQAQKIYIPTLWPAVYEVAAPGSIEYKMVENILPMPIDQRYGTNDMEYMINKLEELL